MRKFAKHPLFVVFLTIFLDMLGFGILIPVIPQLFANPQSKYFLLNEYNLTLQQGNILVGLLTASYPAAQFFAAPILGQLSDKLGRKGVLLLSLSGTCLSYLIFAFGLSMKSLPILFASRIFDGFTGGNIAVAQAVVADVSTPVTKAKNFGLVGAAFALGFILGPTIGGLLSSAEFSSFAHVTTPFYFAALLSFVNVLSVYFQLPETNTNINSSLKVSPLASIKHIVEAFSLKSAKPLFFTALLLQGGFTFFTTISGVYLTQTFNFTESAIGLYFAFVGLWIIFTQGFLIRKLGINTSEHKMVRYSLFVVAAGLAFFVSVNHTYELYLVSPIFIIPYSLANTKLTSLISKSVGPERQGEIMGIYSSVSALATSVPPVLAGFVASGFGTNFSIITASAVVGAAGIYFWRYRVHSVQA